MDQRYKKLVLLHSNDMHGDFFAEEKDGAQALVGGVSMLSGYISKVRAQEPNTLYCIAGDMFRGSVIDSEFKGISTIEIMNMLAPDVVTLGNHETDYGLAHLLFLEKCARFPIINANLYIKTNHAPLFRPQVVLEVDGMKILFVGVITQEVLNQTKKDGIIGTFVDIEDAAAGVGRICNAYNSLDIDLTVLLTHIGFEEDKALAARLDPAWGVDLIIGGHSHTFMEEPTVVNGIPIVQAGTGTDQIGRFDLVVDTQENAVDSFTWQPVPIDQAHCPRDEALEQVVNGYKTQTDAKFGRVLTRLNRRLTHPSRTMETDLGGLFADAMKEGLGVDIFLLASGSVRTEALGPIVMYKDFTECLPYDDMIYMLKVTGAQLRHMIAHMLRDEVWQGAHTEFYQLSERLAVVYDRATHEFRTFTFNGAPVKDEDVFTLGLQEFHFNIIDQSFDVTLEEVSRLQKPRVIATSCSAVAEEYLSTHSHLGKECGHRLVIL